MGRVLLRRSAVVLLVALASVIALWPGAAVAGGDAASAGSDGSVTVVGEIVAQRTSNSNTYQLSNGMLRTQVFENPIRFRNDKGEWQAIDTRLVPEGLFAGYRSAATPVGVLFAEAPGQTPVSLQIDGFTVGIEMLGADKSASRSVGSDSVTYAGVATDTDLTYRVLDDGVKETIALASVAAPSSFSFALYHDGLKLARDETGQWGLYTPKATKPLLIMPRLTVSDSSSDELGEPAYCDAAQMSVDVGAKKSTVTYTVPVAWLADAARVYPVKIDPTLDRAASADTYVSSANPNTSYGSEQEIKTGYYLGAHRRGLVKFDISPIASSAYVRAATFSIWQTGGQSPDTDVEAYVGTSSKVFSESSTWNSLNYTVGTQARDVFLGSPALSNNEWLNQPCRDAVQDWVSGTTTNKGFYLNQNEDNPDNRYWRRFASREYTTDTTKRPNLSVDYETPSATPVSDPAGGCETGETVAVTVNVSGTNYAGEIREIRMGVNRAGGVSSRYRGVMGWFLAKPASPWKTVNKAEGGYLAYYNDTAYGSDHVTADLAASQISADHTQATFVFKVNSNYGDIQNNDFDTYLAMGPSSVSWNSGWVVNDTNFAIYPMAVTHIDYSTSSSGWYNEVDTTPADGVPDNPNCDTNDQGRGDVTLDWETSPLADGYRVYLWDGGAYQPVGKVVGAANTAWSTGDLRFYPKDSEIAAAGWPQGATGNPFYRASTPDDSSQIQLLQPSGYSGSAGVLAGDGSYLYARARSSQAGSTYWKRIDPATQAVTQFGPNLSTKPALSAFCYNARVYSGYVTKSGSTASISGVQTASSYGDGGTITFATLPLERDTGAAITASTHNVLLACDGANIYNVAYTLTTNGGSPVYDGFKVRKYDMTGYPVSTTTVTMPSYRLGHVLVDGGSIYLCEWKDANGARVLKLAKGDCSVVNEWEQDQGTTQVCAGFFDATNNLFWLGHLSTNKFYKYGGSAGGFDLRDDPSRMYAKTDGATGDPWTCYRFCVVPYSGAAGSRSVADPAAIIDEQLPVTLERRTAGCNDDRQHTTYDLGAWNGHEISAVLDARRLELGTSDLAIASWGPPAVLDRFYSSARTNAGTRWAAPGWRFGFEQRLDATYANLKTYTDATGETHRYAYVNGAWQTPKGSAATLTPSGSEWVLTFPDENKLVFDSSGKLVRETDKNGNQTTYTWSGSDMTTITAANGQTITLSYSSGKVTQATYSTAAGTRQVNYATASPWRVTHYPGQAEEETDEYTYASNRLTSLTQRDWPKAGSNVTEVFAYTGNDLSGVNFADYATNSEAHVEITYTTNTATVTGHGRVNDTPNTSVPIETVTINSDGTCAQRKLAQNASENTTTSYAYNIGFLPAKITEPDGGAICTSSDSSGHVVGSIDQDEDLVVSTYDYGAGAAGRLDETTVSGTDQQSQFVYGGEGELIQEIQVLDTSGEKGVTEYTYADVSVGGATFHGALTCEKRLIDGEVGIDPQTGYATVTNGVWAETDYDSNGYWPNGQPKRVVNKGVQLTFNGTPQDLSTNRDYDAFGNPHTETDTSGTRTTQHSHYDLAGRLVDNADACGATTHYVYDELGYQIEVYTTHTSTQVKADWSRDYLGNSPTDWTEYGLDAMGRTLKQWTYLDNGTTATLQSMVECSHDGLGRQITSNDNTVGGQNAKAIYDMRGNATSEFEEGVQAYEATCGSRTTYDVEDMPISSWVPGSNEPTVDVYTEDGYLARETHPDGSWEEYTYDDGVETSDTRPLSGYGANHSRVAISTSVRDTCGRLAAEIGPGDSAGQLISHEYDSSGRLTASDGGRGASASVYNSVDWLLRSADADCVTVQYSYDTAGRPTSETHGTVDPDTGEFTAAQSPAYYTYDDCGRILTQTDPDGKVITHVYDGFGNQVEERHAVSSTEVKHIDTTVDSLGRPTIVHDTVSGLRRSYDYPYAGMDPLVGVKETLRYDTAGTVSTTINRSARDVEDNRVTTATGSPNLVVTSTINTRDAADRWTQTTFATNTSAQRLFDDAGRLARQWGSGYAAGAASTDAYAFDPDTGLKTADNLQLTLGGTIATSYTYDEFGRLASAGTANYGYDEYGNLFTDGTKTLFYDGANRLIQTKVGGSITAVYKWNTSYGWRTSQGPTDASQPITYGDTATGRLATYANILTGVSATYSYDGAGQRSRSVVTQSGATTTTDYTYDGLTLLGLSATKASQSWKICYLYDEEGMPYGAIYRDPASSTSPLVFGIVTSDRGDVVELLDANRTPFAAYRYDAWGVPASPVTQATSLINASLAQTIAERQVLRCASYCWDAESGLYHCSVRSYDPTTRQWLSKDPEKAYGEESAYQYCGGEPVNQVDETGCAAFPTYVWKKWRDYVYFAFRKRVKAIAENLANDRKVPWRYGAPWGQWEDTDNDGKLEPVVTSPNHPKWGLDCCGFVQLVLHRAKAVVHVGGSHPSTRTYRLGIPSPWLVDTYDDGMWSCAGKKGTPSIKYFGKAKRTPYRIGDVLDGPDHIILVIGDGKNPRVAESTCWNGAPKWDKNWKKDGVHALWTLGYRWNNSGWHPTRSGRYFRKR